MQLIDTKNVRFSLCGDKGYENGNGCPDTICEIYDDELTEKFKDDIKERIEELEEEFARL